MKQQQKIPRCPLRNSATKCMRRLYRRAPHLCKEGDIAIYRADVLICDKWKKRVTVIIIMITVDIFVFNLTSQHLVNRLLLLLQFQTKEID